MSAYVIYDVTVSLLTPLHIGTGRKLLHEYDYAIHDGQTWRINEDALLDAQDVDDPRLAAQLARTKPVELLRTDDYRPDSPFFRYVLAGEPRSQAEIAPLQEQIKDPYDRPYLPGSSLKGALRTVIAWFGYRELGLSYQTSRLGSRRKGAASRLEKIIFRPGDNRRNLANFDLFRAIQISDSQPLPPSVMEIINTRVFTGDRKPGSLTCVEAIRRDTEFTLTMKLDKFMQSEQAERELKFGSRWRWLEQLPTIAQGYAKMRLEEEQTWYQNHKYSEAASFCAALLRYINQGKLGNTSFFLQVGWGGGWSSKTIGKPLQENQVEWERLLSDRARSPIFDRRQRERRRSNTPFPVSRRLGQIKTNGPFLPLGWALVEMKERKG